MIAPVRDTGSANGHQNNVTPKIKTNYLFQDILNFKNVYNQFKKKSYF